MAKRFPLAEHRYGREELLQLFSDDTTLPSDMPNLAPVTRKQLLIPLSFMPLSEEEQVCVCGTDFEADIDLSRPLEKSKNKGKPGIFFTVI